MTNYTLSFQQVDKTKHSLVGGKGANLGELSSIRKVEVPDGFCITTDAYAEFVESGQEFKLMVKKLSALKPNESKRVGEIGAAIRKMIEQLSIPQNLDDEISRRLASLGKDIPYAIRSSATAEDLPHASFAGQQDTYLNIIGKDEIKKHICKCWASLFTDRAIIYRMQNGFDHLKVRLAVVIQKMIFPEVSGILFTADPITGNRKVLSIDASFGLGEALVSGIVNADIYKVNNGTIVDKKISAKKKAILALPHGGTVEQEIGPAQQNAQALTDQQTLLLERTGRQIEKYFGVPQDIEWCLASGALHIVQSRPITTLYPVPEAPETDNRVYISVGHQQMMTDAIKPLGLSLWQQTSFAPMHKAGGRLFVDVTKQLYAAESRIGLLMAMGQHDPLIKDALTTLIDRGDFITTTPPETKKTDAAPSNTFHAPPPMQADSALVVKLIKDSKKSLAEVKESVQSKNGIELLDFIQEDIQGYFRKSLFDPTSMGVIMTGINASGWINEKIGEWLGEKNVADILSRSAVGNVTSEMGLELLEVADVIRAYPDVIAFLQNTQSDNFLNELPKYDGGQKVQSAIISYLDKYGMRCPGEIDITRTRWSENPSVLIPILLSHIKTFERGESTRKFLQGQQEARAKEEEIMSRLKQLPDGEQKATETKQRIDLIRTFSGYREYPKYSIVSRYFVYKQALLKEGERLAQNKVLHDREDIYYLTLQEIRTAISDSKVDYQIINQRKEEFLRFEKLSPPRVITSDGEIIAGKYKKENIPADAIVGLPVSSGVIEGRARVILDLENADLEPGDILVTSFTDPSWTPLFVSIKGLITEVGGLMTHGAVIAREYGLPAVVGVENATALIKDGQRIRVHGTEGYIEILQAESSVL
jgi:phosphoenolpyruvate synthase/pyruvate phosphate dikinase